MEPKACLTITLPDAAEKLGFPLATTERVARDLGLLIFAGNRKRIDPNDLSEIMNACRSERKERASTSAKTRAYGSSETRAAETVQQARESAARLKRPSQPISRSATDALVVPLNRASS